MNNKSLTPSQLTDEERVVATQLVALRSRLFTEKTVVKKPKTALPIMNNIYHPLNREMFIKKLQAEQDHRFLNSLLREKQVEKIKVIPANPNKARSLIDDYKINVYTDDEDYADKETPEKKKKKKKCFTLAKPLSKKKRKLNPAEDVQYCVVGNCNYHYDAHNGDSVAQYICHLDLHKQSDIKRVAEFQKK